jgi:hypothetical protein
VAQPGILSGHAVFVQVADTDGMRHNALPVKKCPRIKIGIIILMKSKLKNRNKHMGSSLNNCFIGKTARMSGLAGYDIF